jgi:hypothetical protein
MGAGLRTRVGALGRGGLTGPAAGVGEVGGEAGLGRGVRAGALLRRWWRVLKAVQSMGVPAARWRERSWSRARVEATRASTLVASFMPSRMASIHSSLPVLVLASGSSRRRRDA